MKCPNCHTDTTFVSEYETVEIDQCKTCFGIWLDQDELTKIVENRTLKFRTEDIKNTIKLAFSGVPTEEVEKEERNCPKCDIKLNPLNYNYSSGIIIDVCPNGHGMWLDKNELENIQQSREYWIDNVNENEKSLTKMVEDITDEPTKVGFQSLLFNLSVEASSILEKLKKK